MWRFWSSVLLVMAVAAGCGGAGESPPGPASPGTQPPASAAAEAPEPDASEPAIPDPRSLPVAVAPQSLGEVDLPDTDAAIVALFDRLPTELAGGRRTPQEAGPDRFAVTYETTEPVGCGIRLQALDVSTGDFFPAGWTAEKVVSMFTEGADWDVEDFGREGDLYWVRNRTTCGEAAADVGLTTMWGQAGSRWVFSTEAGSPDVRDELTEAFVAATR